MQLKRSPKPFIYLQSKENYTYCVALILMDNFYRLLIGDGQQQIIFYVHHYIQCFFPLQGPICTEGRRLLSVYACQSSRFIRNHLYYHFFACKAFFFIATSSAGPEISTRHGWITFRRSFILRRMFYHSWP